jgi:RNA polymerase-binding transcription factor DksA
MKGKSGSGRRRPLRLRVVGERQPEEPKPAHPTFTAPHPTLFLSRLSIILLLKREYDRLKEDIGQLALLHTSGREPGNDEADDANDLIEQIRRLALKRQLEATLAQVEHALRRLEAGSYGLCERCGQLIHPERLKALPYASLCIGCASLRAA